MNTKDIHQNLLRLAMTLAVAVLTTAAAFAQDVPLKTATLKAGTGSGSDITITSHDAGRYYGNDINGYNVPNGQFYTDGDDLWLKMPDCPDSFTPPAGMAFAGWNLNGSSTFHFFPGGKFNMTMDVVLWAKWEEANPSITTTDMNGIGYWSYIPANAHRGDYIDFIIIFNEGQYEAGYRLQSVTVTGTDGSSFEITTNGLGEEFLNHVYNTNSSYVYSLGFTMPATSVTLTANWIVPVDHSIILTNDGHGTATASPTSGVVNTKVTLTAEPDEGYLFKEWQVLAGGVTIDNTNEFLIGMEDVAVKAIFRPIVQAVIHFDAGEGTVTPASMTTGINGKLASLPTPIREGWKFEGWFTATAGGTKVTTETLIEEETMLYARWYQGSHYTLVMPDIVELIPGTERTPVTFEATELELAQDANGYTPSWLRMNFSQGTLVNQTDNSKTIAFKVERETWPYPTRQINLDMTSTGTNTFYIYVSSDDWESAALGTYTGTLPCMVGYFYSVDNISFEQIETRNIPVTVTIQASGYDVSVAASPEGGGTVTGGGTYDVDDLVIVTATPESGYKFVNWTENGEEVSTSATYSFLATANRSIVANFERVYTITVSADPTEGGTVTGGTSGTYTLGTQMEFKATPNEGYRFKNWTENGEEVSTSATYSFLATGNRSIVANFERVHTITVSTDPADGGTVTGGTSGTYALGTQFEFKETPNEGYRFVNWTIDGINGGSETTYPFTVNGDFSTVVAHFERIYPLSGDYVVFYPEDGYDPITVAAEGDKVLVSADPDKFPQGENKYFTGQYMATEGVTVTVDESGDGTFIMPAKAVTVSAVLADQEEYTLNLTTTTPQEIPASIWLLLYGLDDGINVYDDNTGDRFLDLNLDGNRDIQLTEDNNETTGVTTYSATRLAGADAITADLRFAVGYIVPMQYNSVLFKLCATDGSLTPPTGIKGLTYSGAAQDLITAGTTNIGTILYSANGTDYSTTIPQGTDAKEYTVYYKVQAKTGYQNVDPVALKVTIAPKAVTVTAQDATKFVGEDEPALTATVEGVVGTDKVSYTISRATGEAPGEYDITVTGEAAQGNYVVTFVNGAKLTVILKGDLNGDGVVDVADVVKAIAEGMTQAEIDEIVSIIMGKK